MPIPAPTRLPTDVPIPAPTPVPIPAPTAVPIPAPTAVPIPEPTAVPLPAPTAVPILAPTAVPIPAPTAAPIPAPTAVPLPAPTTAASTPCASGDDCSDLSSYYCGIDLTLTGAVLAAQLQARVASPHTVIPYTSSATDCWDALSVLDADPSNADHIIEVYTQASVDVSLQGDTEGWNREHMYALC